MPADTGIVDNLARLIGQGVSGVLNPVSSTYFLTLSHQLSLNPIPGSGGSDLPTSTEESTLFFPAVAIRNMAFGVSILALSWQGQRQAIVTIVAEIAVAGVANVQLALQKGGRWQQHAIGTALAGALDWALHQVTAECQGGQGGDFLW